MPRASRAASWHAAASILPLKFFACKKFNAYKKGKSRSLMHISKNHSHSNADRDIGDGKGGDVSHLRRTWCGALRSPPPILHVAVACNERIFQICV